MPLRIEDYALIGDCETAALVGRDGSIDWLCFPRFDSGACFAALLGDPGNGRWLIAPAEKVQSVSRRYRPDTMILETEFETEHGSVTLTDWMPVRSVTTASDLIRVVEGKRGQVRMQMELVIRFDYGSAVPWVRRTPWGIRATAGPDSLEFRADVPFRGEDLRTVADFTVSEAQRVAFDLEWHPTYGPEPAGPHPETSLRDTELWWQQWCSRCAYEGEWQEAVRRSLITLKALTYAPTGGLVAAPTTSLPEQLGGVRNWDYRYCWVRDPTLPLYALINGGYLEEACAWRDWLVNAVAGSPAEMHIMYGLAGERRLPELVLPWLSGYAGSAPVRIGNDAHRQFQLDVYGELMDTLVAAHRAGLAPSQHVWGLQRALLKFVETAWRLPDEGIWEIRGPRRHFTHSKVMAWVALDRAVKAVEDLRLDGPVDGWRRICREIHNEVCRMGFDAELNSFVQYYGAKHVDASLLMLPQIGFLPADDPRIVGTVNAVKDRLMRDGFVYRYPTMPEIDGLPSGEGAFLPCTFWLADALSLQGRHAEAREIFERLLSIRNDVGLLSEEYDPESRRLVGNFPQAFSHVALVNTARNLTKPRGPAEERQSGSTASRG